MELSDLAPDEVPKTSRFLLEINFTELTKALLKIQHYWTLAMNSTLKAQRLEAKRGGHLKRIQKLVNHKIPSRKKLRVVALEQQIRPKGCTLISPGVHTQLLKTTPKPPYPVLLPNACTSQCRQHPQIQQAPQKTGLSKTPRQAMCQRLHL